MFEFAKEMYFDGNDLGNRSVRDKSLIGLLQSPGIMASGISTLFFTRKYQRTMCYNINITRTEKSWESFP